MGLSVSVAFCFEALFALGRLLGKPPRASLAISTSARSLRISMDWDQPKTARLNGNTTEVVFMFLCASIWAAVRDSVLNNQAELFEEAVTIPRMCELRLWPQI
jgi:hypothetical protein